MRNSERPSPAYGLRGAAREVAIINAANSKEKKAKIRRGLTTAAISAMIGAGVVADAYAVLDTTKIIATFDYKNATLEKGDKATSDTMKDAVVATFASPVILVGDELRKRRKQR